MPVGLSPSVPLPVAMPAGSPATDPSKLKENASAGTHSTHEASAFHTISIPISDTSAITVRLSVGDGQEANRAKQGREAQKGFFATIVDKIKDFFVGLFGTSKPAKSQALALPASSHEQQVRSEAVATPESPSVPISAHQLSIPANLSNDAAFLAAFKELVRKHSEPAAEQTAGSVPMAPPMGAPDAPPMAPPLGAPDAPPMAPPMTPSQRTWAGRSQQPASRPTPSPANPQDQLLAAIRAGAKLKSTTPSDAQPVSPANPQDALLAEIRAGAKLKSVTPPASRPASPPSPQDELFKAIRSGAKLKPASERAASPPRPGIPEQPMSLMDQMKARLEARRKAVEGNEKK